MASSWWSHNDHTLWPHQSLFLWGQTNKLTMCSQWSNIVTSFYEIIMNSQWYHACDFTVWVNCEILLRHHGDITGTSQKPSYVTSDWWAHNDLTPWHHVCDIMMRSLWGQTRKLTLTSQWYNSVISQLWGHCDIIVSSSYHSFMRSYWWAHHDLIHVTSYLWHHGEITVRSTGKITLTSQWYHSVISQLWGSCELTVTSGYQNEASVAASLAAILHMNTAAWRQDSQIHLVLLWWVDLSVIYLIFW